ncbi:MAG: hypothetical protein K9N47_22425 [Prosthecobacter sp.]|uniref:hypothetical protein n=1 Tax=Prosthecobacter sp. TaxID=1965333 RepID=UPI00262CDF88|nr:hypothetical protein [Prosthecobacter sp.]MCF7788898.1 hypothetical protein [Prosthecobacter sp.]
MKTFLTAILALWLAAPASATTAALVRTYQPFAWTSIYIEPVTCYAWNAQTYLGDALRYISAKNIPPNFAKEPGGDINLASTSHLFFDNDYGSEKPLTLFMKADEFVITEGYSREDIVKACLECVRRLLPAKYLKTPLTFSASPENKDWMTKIVDEFNQHDRSKVFFGAEP